MTVASKSGALLSCVGLVLVGTSALQLSLFVSTAQGTVLYYNDGTVPTYQTGGDTAVGVPWNYFFEPGQFMDGTPDDVPPFNTFTNPGLATLKGAAGGVNGGVFRELVPVLKPFGKGVFFWVYGSLAKKKEAAQGAWRTQIRRLAGLFGVNPANALQQWETQRQFILNDGTPVKIISYIGDPMVSISPDDLPLSVLQDPLEPTNNMLIRNAIADPNVIPIFWEVTGSRGLETIDLFWGDHGMTDFYGDVTHHFPWIAVLDDVGPEDFGLDPLSVARVQFNGDNLAGPGNFVQPFFIAGSDVIVPEPASGALCLLGVGWLSVLATDAMLRRQRRRSTV